MGNPWESLSQAGARSDIRLSGTKLNKGQEAILLVQVRDTDGLN